MKSKDEYPTVLCGTDHYSGLFRSIKPLARTNLSCIFSPMEDIDLLIQALRRYGHTVESAISVPDNAGGYELFIDGKALNLDEARQLLEEDQAK